MKNIPYIEAIGSLLYIAINTRPDIFHQVSELGKFCANPGKQHWEAVKKVFQYLHFTPTHGIAFGMPHDANSNTTTIQNKNFSNQSQNNSTSLPFVDTAAMTANDHPCFTESTNFPENFHSILCQICMRLEWG